VKTQDELTPRQQSFVQEYLIDLNATQAAVRAGYSPRTAEQQGSRLLSNVKVSSAICSAKAERSERTKVDADWLLRRLAAEAEADLQEIFEDDGRVKPVRQWPAVWRTGLVAGLDAVELPEGVVVKKLKLADRSKTLEMIGKHIDVGAWREQVKHDLGELGPDWKALLRKPEGAD
jgi:phage terminase small subunit